MTKAHKSQKSQTLKNLEKQLNVEVSTSYDNGDKVREVKFRFSKEEWADMANKEGELLPVCCANISTIRNVLVAALREDGVFSVEEMERIVVNMDGHDWEENHPVSKIKQVYKALLSHLEPRTVSSVSQDSVQGAASRVWFDEIWKFCSSYSRDSMFHEWGKTAQDRATHNKRLYDIMPTVRALYKFLDKTKFGPAEGFAIVRKATNELYEFYDRGLALFRNQEEADKCLERWMATKQVPVGDVEIRKVRISLENGVEFIEEITEKWEADNTPSIDKNQARELWYKISELRNYYRCRYKNDKVEAILLKAMRDLKVLETADD